mmetsp:Transcript_14745/g.22451  ORF Transcript_14745/g.22451 Transcript_14745/m.22451 type:complete len:211 (+) Transcript_14745:632-1264(+)
MVMSNFPLTIFVNINKAVPGLNLVTSSSHGELIDTNILAPIITGCSITFQNYSLGLELKKVDKVILDGIIIGTRGVRNSGKKNSLSGISLGYSIRIKSGKGIVPQVKQIASFTFTYSPGHLWHSLGRNTAGRKSFGHEVTVDGSLNSGSCSQVLILSEESGLGARVSAPGESADTGLGRGYEGPHNSGFGSGDQGHEKKAFENQHLSKKM